MAGSLAKLDVDVPHPFVRQLAERAAASRCDPRQLGNLVWALARLDPELQVVPARCLEDLGRQVAQLHLRMKAQELVIVIYAFGIWKHVPQTVDLGVLVAALVAEKENIEPQVLIECKKGWE